MLEYPKEVMKTSELVEMGFPEKMLLNAYRVKGQTFAQKSDPAKRNSPIIFFTKQFEKWREEQQRIENRSIQRGFY